MNPWNKVADIFLPFAMREEREVSEGGQRFAHYTSAAVAMSIIQNRELWMRKLYVMNDSSEVEHGAMILAELWGGPLGDRYRRAMEAAKPGLAQEIIEIFQSWLEQSKHNTYVACVSKHHDHEDETGRLSMWRAYGGDCGVALVFNGDPFVRDENTLNVFTSPAAYLSEADFEREFTTVVENIEGNIEFLRVADPEAVHELGFRMFVFAVAAAKNPGFREEEEWRIICAPYLWPSEYVRPSIEIIAGRPQKVFKLPLDGGNDPKLDWLSLDAILDRVIIGPGVDKDVTGEAIFELLAEAGVQNPKTKVFLSTIPLRT